MTSDPAKTGFMGVLITACLVIFIAMLDIFSPGTGIMIVMSYLAFALLYIGGHYRFLMSGLAVIVTFLITAFIFAGDRMGIFTGAVPLLIFVLWMAVLWFSFEYILISGGHGLEKAAMYRQYLLLNMVQSLNLLFSTAMLAFGARLSEKDGALSGAALDACTLSVILFFSSFFLFVSFFLKQALSHSFMSDFSRAIYDAGREGEYGDRKQGIKDAAGSPFPGAYRRMRLITYLLFAASLFALFMIHKSGVIDAYASAISGKNTLIDGIIHMIKYPPRAVSSIVNIVFLIMNILIIWDLIRLPAMTKLIQRLKGSNAPAKDR